MSRSRQANAQANGWYFEYAAALFLFLKYSDIVKEIGIEKEEDIRLLTKNNEYIVAQAKSSLEIKDIYDKDHYAEVKKALLSLSDTGLSNINKYIIVANFVKPFGNDSVLDFVNDTEQEYKITDFQEKVVAKLESYIAKEKIEIDLENVFYQFLKFQGNNPYEYIRKILASRLVVINKNADVRADIILNKLISLFKNNSRLKKEGIEKDILLGAIFSCIASNSLGLDDISDASGVEFDIHDAGILDEINRFFNEQSASLAIYSDIYCKFLNYCDSSNMLRDKGESLSSYINSLSDLTIPEYFSSFFGGTEYDLLKMYKLFIAFVCVKNNLIELVRKAFI